jgi:hypothetical protein
VLSLSKHNGLSAVRQAQDEGKVTSLDWVAGTGEGGHSLPPFCTCRGEDATGAIRCEFAPEGEGGTNRDVIRGTAGRRDSFIAAGAIRNRQLLQQLPV